MSDKEQVDGSQLTQQTQKDGSKERQREFLEVFKYTAQPLLVCVTLSKEYFLVIDKFKF